MSLVVLQVCGIRSKVLSTLDMNSCYLVEVPWNLAGMGRFLGTFLLVRSVATGGGGGDALVGASMGQNKWLKSCPSVLCLFEECGKFSTLGLETT